MPITGGGEFESGLDRALDNALAARLDTVLESGDLWEGERAEYPDTTPRWDPRARPWQRPIGEERRPPSSEEPIRSVPGLVLRRGGRPSDSRSGATPDEALPVSTRPPAGDSSGRESPEVRAGMSPEAAGGDTAPESGPRGTGLVRRALALLERILRRIGYGSPREDGGLGQTHADKSTGPGDAGNGDEKLRTLTRENKRLELQTRQLTASQNLSPSERYKAEFKFRDELTGIVLIHGIGPQSAGKTLLDWSRPIVTLLADASVGDAGLAQPSPEPGRSDPVFRSSIDFSGATLPVLQLRIPTRTDVDRDDPRAKEKRWIVTEAWWASEVRPPSLSMMTEWLGEQGGVARIVQGIQQNMLGRGVFGTLGRVSLQAFVSVIVAFVMLVFIALLGLSRLIPFGPLKDAVVLQMGSSFLTDWFGGARTLLRDPVQSANVRRRLLTSIKALRAYGCRNVVVVAHSGGTIASLATLTDPAYPDLRIDKLITIGEALNLGWRLDDENPDNPPPTPPEGDRMRGDMAKRNPRMQWRDFFGSHDPAPAGSPPDIPSAVMTNPGAPWFTAERVYNRMSIGEDHGGYWDNDEQFLIPLIRELDTPTADRGSSRFYSDAAESRLRARRKERVSLLALWRRVTLALPVMALAATVATSGRFVRDAGDAVFAAYAAVPGHDILTSFGRTVAGLGNGRIFGDAWPGLLGGLTWDRWYGLGILVLQAALVLLVLYAIVPGRADRLWWHRPIPRLVLFAVDVAVGLGALVAILVAIGDPGRVVAIAAEPVVALVAFGGGLWAFGMLGSRVRATIRGTQGDPDLLKRFGRDLLIVASAAFLAAVLVALLVIVVGVALVFAGTGADASPAGIASAATRTFVLGAIAVLVGFSLLGRLGTWRWDAWDERERRALRRRPLESPFRYWSYFVALMLAVGALGAAVLVSSGETTGLGIVSPVTVAAWILAIVVLSVGKDVVDNDTQTAR